MIKVTANLSPPLPLSPEIGQTKNRFQYLYLNVTQAFWGAVVADTRDCLTIATKIFILVLPIILVLEGLLDLVTFPFFWIANQICPKPILYQTRSNLTDLYPEPPSLVNAGGSQSGPSSNDHSNLDCPETLLNSPNLTVHSIDQVDNSQDTNRDQLNNGTLVLDQTLPVISDQSILDPVPEVTEQRPTQIRGGGEEVSSGNEPALIETTLPVEEVVLPNTIPEASEAVAIHDPIEPKSRMDQFKEGIQTKLNTAKETARTTIHLVSAIGYHMLYGLRTPLEPLPELPTPSEPTIEEVD